MKKGKGKSRSFPALLSNETLIFFSNEALSLVSPTDLRRALLFDIMGWTVIRQFCTISFRNGEQYENKVT